MKTQCFAALYESIFRVATSKRRQQNAEKRNVLRQATVVLVGAIHGLWREQGCRY